MTDFRIELIEAKPNDLDRLYPLVTEFHALEQIKQTGKVRRSVLSKILGSPDLGRIWLVEVQNQLVGYIAFAFGFSIELGGRDAYIDEFFLIREVRGRGFGAKVISLAMSKLRQSNVAAVYLEVAKENGAARRLYRNAGFKLREKYHLMICDLNTEASDERA